MEAPSDISTVLPRDYAGICHLSGALQRDPQLAEEMAAFSSERAAVRRTSRDVAVFLITLSLHEVRCGFCSYLVLVNVTLGIKLHHFNSIESKRQNRHWNVTEFVQTVLFPLCPFYLLSNWFSIFAIAVLELYEGGQIST